MSFFCQDLKSSPDSWARYRDHPSIRICCPSNRSERRPVLMGNWAHYLAQGTAKKAKRRFVNHPLTSLTLAFHRGEKECAGLQARDNTRTTALFRISAANTKQCVPPSHSSPGPYQARQR